MCILSLDISTASTGWCITSNGCLFTLGNIVVDSKLSTSVKLCLFAEELESILIKYSPTHIVQEDIFSGKNVSTMKRLSEFAGISKYMCYNICNIEPYIISNKTVKAYFKAQDKQLLFDFICVRSEERRVGKEC